MDVGLSVVERGDQGPARCLLFSGGSQWLGYAGRGYVDSDERGSNDAEGTGGGSGRSRQVQLGYQGVAEARSFTSYV
jgi:hypothetical protein